MQECEHASTGQMSQEGEVWREAGCNAGLIQCIKTTARMSTASDCRTCHASRLHTYALLVPAGSRRSMPCQRSHQVPVRDCRFPSRCSRFEKARSLSLSAGQSWPASLACRSTGVRIFGGRVGISNRPLENMELFGLRPIQPTNASHASSTQASPQKIRETEELTGRQTGSFYLDLRVINYLGLVLVRLHARVNCPKQRSALDWASARTVGPFARLSLPHEDMSGHFYRNTILDLGRWAGGWSEALSMWSPVLSPNPMS